MTTLAGRRAVQDVATVEWTRVSKATELVEAARQQVPAIEVGGLVRGMPMCRAHVRDGSPANSGTRCPSASGSGIVADP